MKEKKRILVAPLDWGIGHATRCIPIINELIQHDFEVIIAADERPMHLLINEFPNLEVVRFKGYNIKYSTYIPMFLSMLIQLPKLHLRIKKEHTTLQRIISDYNIDGVISDNRFGLYSKKIPTVFITHQLKIQSSFLIKAIQKTNYKYINRFDVCWVVDDKKNNLAGELSKPNNLPNNTKYIGIQSRFQKYKTKNKYKFMAIVSGPEPQRTVLEKGLIEVLKNQKEKSMIVLGKPEKKYGKNIENLTIKSHLNTEDLNLAILQSELIICRPGYSTVMDLSKLEKKAIFIPTPGQTEQEYLAKILKEKELCFYQNQSDFNLEVALEKSKKYNGLKHLEEDNLNWKELFSLFQNK